MPKITSPYNFVPLAPVVYTPDWANDVTMDIPFEDGEDGVITIKIKNISPLFVRDGHAKTDDESWKTNPEDERNFSAHVNIDGKYRYFIPGTTLKGCIRNVLEALSFAKMVNYDNDSFGYRSFDNEDYKEKMEDVEVGWLKKVNESYQLYPCDGKVQIITHQDIKKTLKIPYFDAGQNHQTAERKQRSVKAGEEWYPIKTIKDGELADVTPGEYKLICTGHMDGKNHEYLFPEKRKDPYTLTSAEFERFDTIHCRSEYYSKGEAPGFLKKRLEDGQEIPVFFKWNENGRLDSMGITRNYRYPYKNNVDTVRQNAQPNVDGKDLPEVMFGYANDDDELSLKGRIHFGHAFTNRIFVKNDCPTVEGILAGPKPTFYPQYLLQENGKPFDDYSSDGAKIAGRKRYRIHAASSLTELNKNLKNRKVHTLFRPIPSDTEFTAQIAVHNLRGIEVGALLAALTFNETSGTYHNIGMAKAYGYGKCIISVEKMEGFSKPKEQYFHEFEEAMSDFCKENLGHKLTEDKSISTLLAIASQDHNDQDLQPLPLKDCGEVKKIRKINGELLKEDTKLLMLHQAQRTAEQKVSEYQPEIDAILADAKKDLVTKLKNLDVLKSRLEAQKLPTQIIDDAKNKLINPPSPCPSSTPLVPKGEEIPLAQYINYETISNPKTFIARCNSRSNEVNTPEGLAIAAKWVEDFYANAPSREKKNYKDAQRWKNLPIEQSIIEEWIRKFKK